MAVTFPFVLWDGAGFLWDVQTDGRIKDGSSDAFDGAFDNPDLRHSSTGSLELDGRQLLLVPGTAISNPQVSLERRIYVPTDQPWARFIDTATNTGATATDYTFRLLTNYGADTLIDVVADSDGSGGLNAGDLYVVTDDGNPGGGDPFVGMLFAGGSHRLDYAAFTSVDIADLRLTVTLDPGETLSFLSFGFQSFDLPNVLANLDAPLSAEMVFGLSDEFASGIINFDVTGYFEQTAYFGNEGRDVLIGSERDETFSANAGDDVVLAKGGDDRVDAGDGDDVVRGGDGRDALIGRAGRDVLQGDGGDDLLIGDDGGHTRTSDVLTIVGSELQFTLSVPEQSMDEQISIEGAVSDGTLSHGPVNFVFVLDASNSMRDLYDGPDTVADLNGDGIANQLIDVAIAEFASLHQTMIASGLGASSATILAMGDTAEILYSGPLGGSLGRWHTIQPDGASNYEAALQQSLVELYAQEPGVNHLYVLSDGLPSLGLTYVDEAAELRADDGLNTTIHAVPYGAGASQFDLDLMDDGLANLSLTAALNRADIAAALRKAPDGLTHLNSLEIMVNGSTVTSLDASVLENTPFGVRFSATFGGLIADFDDVVEARLTTDDGSFSLSTTVIDEAVPGFADTLNGGAGFDVLLGQQGDDVLVGDEGRDTLDGGAGDDLLQGGTGEDLLIGGQGNDILNGGAGADVLFGGAGDNTVSYAGSVQRVVVNLGNQTASGGHADGDVLDGFVHVEGSAQNDAITGNYLDNILRGGPGDDWLFGRSGFDTADYSDASASVAVSLKLPDGAQDTGGGGIDYLDDIEALIGSQFDDILVGDSGYNILRGGAGDDVLKSKGGNDKLDGGGGADHLFGNSGAERFIAGAGDDTVNGYSGADTIFGGVGNDTLYGDNGGDEIFGQGGWDTLRGGPGFDILDGGRGNDDLRGSRGNDELLGGSGNDFLGGDEGDDLLDGQAGNDVLLGGTGRDEFRFAGDFGFDALRDFESGTDHLNVSDLNIASFQDFQSRASETNAGLRVDFGGGNVIFIEDFDLTDLRASDLIM